MYDDKSILMWPKDLEKIYNNNDYASITGKLRLLYEFTLSVYVYAHLNLLK